MKLIFFQKRKNFPNHILLTLTALTVTIICAVFHFIGSALFSGDWHLKQSDVPDGEPEIVLISAQGDYTGCFPDIVKLRNGQMMTVFYWNNSDTHAPHDYDDSVGSIRAVFGSSDGLSWETESFALIDEAFLSEHGRGMWVDANGHFYYEQNAARKADARFCVDVRDPNLFVMNNGTVILTYFTRIPVATENGLHYSTGRTCILTSSDDGHTWTAPVEIPCSYLDICCAKRGNICQYSDDSLLIPLYGYSSRCVKLNRRFQKILQSTTACILAKLEETGEWTFLKEYNSRSFSFGLIEKPGIFRPGNNEVSFIADEHDRTLALCRPSGDILRSDDKGRSWKLIGKNSKSSKANVQQPGFCAIPGSADVFVTWSESVTPGNRAVFARIYYTSSEWNPLIKIMLYQNTNSLDMADPSSVYIGDHRMLTVFYDVSAGCIGGVITELFPGKSE